MNNIIQYYDKLQELEKDYTRSSFSQDPSFIKRREDLEQQLGIRENVDAVSYIHHTAFNQGYREGFALAKKQGESALTVATELLRRSSGRVEVLEGRYKEWLDLEKDVSVAAGGSVPLNRAKFGD